MYNVYGVSTDAVDKTEKILLVPQRKAKKSLQSKIDYVYWAFVNLKKKLF